MKNEMCGPLVIGTRTGSSRLELESLSRQVVGLEFARERLMAFTPWHPDAVSGSHPPHLLCAAKRDVRQRLWIYEFTSSRFAISRVQAAQGNQLRQRCLRTARLHRC